MKLEILLSVMNKTSNEDVYSHLKEKNITTDTIVINQANYNSFTDRKNEAQRVRIFNLDEKGVGLSRNTALQRTDADIAVFADDDERFEADYAKKIVQAFEQLPDADIILFNVKSNNPERPSASIKKIKRIFWFSSMKYGGYQIAIRVKAVKKARIAFSLLHGGGSVFGSGEDSLFLLDALKAGLNIYAHPVQIATVEQSQSTWFSGYNKKFFFDRGALYAAAFRFPEMIALIQTFRKRNIYISELTLRQQYKYLCLGIQYFNKKV